MRSVLPLALIGLGAINVPQAEAAAPISDAAPATIRVTLPADAQLTFDGEPTKSTSVDRTFVTPPLEMGKEFRYTLQAQFVRGDDTVTIERRVAVRAGEETMVSFAMPQGSTSNRAFYYDPAAANTRDQSRAFTNNPAAPSYYYSPSVPFYVAPNLDVPHGGVGGARDN